MISSEEEQEGGQEPDGGQEQEEGQEQEGRQEQEGGQEQGSGEQIQQCPGGDLEACVDICPGEFGAKVFGFCVGSCGKRCP